MNRRDLLKRLAALPVIGAVIPAALAKESTARMIYHAPLVPNLPANYFTEPNAWVIPEFQHRWRPGSSICDDCGVTELDVEEGLATRFCEGPLDMDAGLFGFGDGP